MTNPFERGRRFDEAQKCAIAMLWHGLAFLSALMLAMFFDQTLVKGTAWMLLYIPAVVILFLFLRTAIRCPRRAGR